MASGVFREISGGESDWAWGLGSRQRRRPAGPGAGAGARQRAEEERHRCVCVWMCGKTGQSWPPGKMKSRAEEGTAPRGLTELTEEGRAAEEGQAVQAGKAQVRANGTARVQGAGWSSRSRSGDAAPSCGGPAHCHRLRRATPLRQEQKQRGQARACRSGRRRGGLGGGLIPAWTLRGGE